jgi:hypothetical protein
MPRKIYHVVGVKVGLTKNSVEIRCRQQNLWYGYAVDLLRIIPDHLSDKDAGDIEWFYSDHYNYIRGPHYTSNWNNRLTPEQRVKAGKKGGAAGGVVVGRLGTSGFQTGAANRAAVASPNHPSKTGKSGMQTGVAQRASAASPNHYNVFKENPDLASIGGKASAASPNGSLRTGVFQKAGTIAAAASPNANWKKVYTCPTCGFACISSIGMASHKKTHK